MRTLFTLHMRFYEPLFDERLCAPGVGALELPGDAAVDEELPRGELLGFGAGEGSLNNLNSGHDIAGLEGMGEGQSLGKLHGRDGSGDWHRACQNGVVAANAVNDEVELSFGDTLALGGRQKSIGVADIAPGVTQQVDY